MAPVEKVPHIPGGAGRRGGGWRGGGPTWMSGPQSTLSGVGSLWVSERPSVMTSTIWLLSEGGSSRSRVYCRASPVNVPPAIHRSFLMALWGQSTCCQCRGGAGGGPGCQGAGLAGHAAALTP